MTEFPEPTPITNAAHGRAMIEWGQANEHLDAGELTQDDGAPLVDAIANTLHLAGQLGLTQRRSRPQRWGTTGPRYWSPRSTHQQ